MRLGTGYDWAFVGFGKGMEEELSTLYLLSTANNVMCRWVAGTGVWHAPSLLVVGATSC